MSLDAKSGLIPVTLPTGFLGSGKTTLLNHIVCQPELADALVIHPPALLPAWPTDDRRSRLVFITQDVGRDIIEETFRAFQDEVPQTREAGDDNVTHTLA